MQSVTYLDADGVRQTLAGAEYDVVTDELVGRLLPAFGKTWPDCRIRPGSVQVSYTCGYGDASDVPQSIKAWMLLAIGAWYENREALTSGKPLPSCRAASGMVCSIRFMCRGVMSAGKLNHRITISGLTAGSDALGQPAQSWLDFATLWADVRFVSGIETIKAGREISTSRASVRIRRRSGITRQMRRASAVWNTTLSISSPVLIAPG